MQKPPRRRLNGAVWCGHESAKPESEASPCVAQVILPVLENECQKAMAVITRTPKSLELALLLYKQVSTLQQACVRQSAF